MERKQMQRLMYLVALVIAAAMAPSVAVAELIYEAFEEPFDSLAPRLPALRQLGFTRVIVSPPQKSLPRPEWWARYQPVDYSRIEGPLGDRASLARLFAAGRQTGVGVLVDTVLNHMANDAEFPGLDFPQFGPDDFHDPVARPCITDYSDRNQAVNGWLCDFRARLPDLRTDSPRVREVQRNYLRDLVEMGASGFRFDAAVNIETETFAWFRKQLPRNLFYFGEVVGTSRSEVESYFPHMRVTDFFLLRDLLQVFGPDGQAHSLEHSVSRGLGPEQIVFARTHDGLGDQPFFNFSDKNSLLLAYTFLLTAGFPNVYVLNRDLDDVRASLDFRQKNLCTSSSFFATGDSSVAAWRRGRAAFVLMNLSMDWKTLPNLKIPDLESGCYRELAYGFEACLNSDGVVIEWSDDKPEAKIGPRTALLFVASAPSRP
jgi:alpha-amylase